MKPNLAPTVGTLAELINTPARNVTTITLTKRANGSLSDNLTTNSSSATAAEILSNVYPLDRRLADGSSRSTRNMKYIPNEIDGSLNVMIMMSVRTDTRTMRRVRLRRPGVGFKSSNSAQAQDQFIEVPAFISPPLWSSRR